MAQYGEVRVDYITYTTGTVPTEANATVTVSSLVNDPVFSGDVQVGGNVTVTGNLNVSGDSLLHDVIIIGDTTLSGDLTTEGAINISGAIQFTPPSNQLRIGEAGQVSPAGTPLDLGLRSASGIAFFAGDQDEKARFNASGDLDLYHDLGVSGVINCADRINIKPSSRTAVPSARLFIDNGSTGGTSIWSTASGSAFQGFVLENTIQQNISSSSCVNFIDARNSSGVPYANVFFNQAPSGEGGFIAFGTTTPGDIGSDRRSQKVQIDVSGQLGVGTLYNNQWTDIRANIHSREVISGALGGEILAQNDATAINTKTAFILCPHVNPNAGARIVSNQYQAGEYADLSFITSDNGVLTTGLIINDNGVTISGGNLNVSGTGRFANGIEIFRNSVAPYILFENDQAPGDGSINYFNTGAMLFQTASGEAGRFTAEGRFGLGQTNPSHLLDVATKSSIYGSGDIVAGRFQGNPLASGYSETAIQIRKNQYGAHIAGFLDQTVSAGVRIAAYNNGSIGPSMYWHNTDGGRLGLKQRDPLTVLHINNGSSGKTRPTLGGFYLENAGTSSSTAIMCVQSSGMRGSDGAFTVMNNGFVGINQSNPDANLSIYGSAGTLIKLRQDAGQFGGISINNLYASGTARGTNFIDSRNENDVANAHLFFQVLEGASDGASQIDYGLTASGDRTTDRRYNSYSQSSLRTVFFDKNGLDYLRMTTPLDAAQWGGNQGTVHRIKTSVKFGPGLPAPNILGAAGVMSTITQTSFEDADTTCSYSFFRANTEGKTTNTRVGNAYGFLADNNIANTSSGEVYGFYSTLGNVNRTRWAYYGNGTAPMYSKGTFLINNGNDIQQDLPLLGGDQFTPQFQLRGNSGATAHLSVARSNGQAYFSVSNGTGGNAAGRDYGSLMGQGYVGNDADGDPIFQTGASIRFKSDAITSSGSMPSQISFEVCNTGEISPSQVGRFTSQGLFQVNGLAASPNAAVYSNSVGVLTNTSSDARLKTNIVSLEKEEDNIRKLNPVRYEWIESEKELRGDRTEIGLIAQEVSGVYPELTAELGTGYMTIDYSKFTGVLIKGLQEAFERIDTLETEIAQLKSN